MKSTMYGVKADPKADEVPVFVPDPVDLDRKFWWADGWWSEDPLHVFYSPTTAWHTWMLDSRIVVPWETPGDLLDLVSKAIITTSRAPGEYIKDQGLIEDIGRVEADQVGSWLLSRGSLVVETDWTKGMGRPGRGGLVDVANGKDRTRMAYVANGLTRATKDRPPLVRAKTGFGRKFGYRGFVYIPLEDFQGLVEEGHAYAGVQ